jgi:hypothetical protein
VLAIPIFLILRDWTNPEQMMTPPAVAMFTGTWDALIADLSRREGFAVVQFALPDCRPCARLTRALTPIAADWPGVHFVCFLQNPYGDPAFPVVRIVRCGAELEILAVLRGNDPAALRSKLAQLIPAR